MCIFIYNFEIFIKKEVFKKTLKQVILGGDSQKKVLIFLKKLFFVTNMLRHSQFDFEKKEAGHRSKPMHGRDSPGSGFM